MKDKDEYVRWRVVWALEDIGDARAIEPLIHALKDEDEDFREVAKEALEKINAKKSWELCENFIQIYDR